MILSAPARLTGNPAGLSELDPEVLGEVRAAHREGRLGYLAGGALSLAIGLPSWNDLNLSLLRHALPYHPALSRDGKARAAECEQLARIYLDQVQGRALAAVDFARLLAGDDFHVVLRRALYERPQLQFYRPTAVHCALAALAHHASPPFPCIHTTNCDDLLERALARVTGRAVTALHAGWRRASDGPRVVHLSGYFPQKPAAAEREPDLARTLLATETDDHLLSHDHLAWTGRELLSLLETRSTLIVGTGLGDPNLHRLLSQAWQQRRDARHRGAERHYVVMQSRDVDLMVDVLVGRSDGRGAHKRRRDARPLAERACTILEENERQFWSRQGVKIIHVDRYDRLNYLLRRIRFSDDEWDREHERLRAAWAERRYGRPDFDHPDLQALGTAVLAGARDRLGAATGMRVSGRFELNLFLPLHDGRYRRAFSSVPGRAAVAPRRFQARHDRFTIPEVERVLTLGEPVTSPKILDRGTLPGEAPYEQWYQSIEGVPYFDDQAGGIPVAVIQLCSSERGGAALDVDGMIRLRGYLVDVVQSVLHALKRFQDGPKVDPQRAR